MSNATKDLQPSPAQNQPMYPVSQLNNNNNNNKQRKYAAAPVMISKVEESPNEVHLMFHIVFWPGLLLMLLGILIFFLRSLLGGLICEALALIAFGLLLVWLKR